LVDILVAWKNYIKLEGTKSKKFIFISTLFVKNEEKEFEIMLIIAYK